MITRSFLFVRLQVKYLEQLLACVDVLLRQCDSDCGSVSLQLLQVLVTVQSLSTEPQLSDQVRTQRRASSFSLHKSNCGGFLLFFFFFFHEARQLFELWGAFAGVQRGHGQLCN